VSLLGRDKLEALDLALALALAIEDSLLAQDNKALLAVGLCLVVAVGTKAEAALLLHPHE